jgi:hypothetical protein
MMNDCKDPHTFDHNTICLIVARALVSSGLGLEFVPTDSHASADLRVRVALRRGFLVEVKAPRALQRRPRVQPTTENLEGIVQKAMKDARSQLSSVPSLLAVGGSYWAGDFDHLESRANDFCATRGHKKPSVIGILFVSKTTKLERLTGGGRVSDDSWHKVGFVWDNTFRWVANPHCIADPTMQFRRNFVGEYQAHFDPGQPPAYVL